MVEDEPSTLTVVRYHLESAGFHGVFATKPDEGWRLLVSESPDLAVVDIRLPGGDGWSLIDRMRKDDRFASLPVIVLSGGDEKLVASQAATLKCDYLSKPFAATALLAKIRHLIAISGSRGLEAGESGRGDVVHVELVAIGVVLLMGSYRIQGKVYLGPEQARFSDAWESVMRDQRTFVPVTDAQITSESGQGITSPAFVEVRKADIQAVFPMDVAPD